MSDSELAPSLIAAFRATHYQVFTAQDSAFTMRIDQRCEALAQLHRKSGVACSAYLTAWNPYSAETPIELNHAQQKKLYDEMDAAGHQSMRGFGFDPENTSLGEQHLLVLGISRIDAIECGRRYQQNAIVWSGENAVPELILLR